MSKIDRKYHKLVKKIKKKGTVYEDPNRKGIYRHQIPHYIFKHRFKDGFPALTTKKLAWKSVVGELLWILRGDTNIKYLVDNGIPIWNKDAYNYYLSKRHDNSKAYSIEKYIEEVKSRRTLGHLGGVGRNYGAQLRNWRGSSKVNDGPEFNTVDQLANLIHTLKTNPMATKKTVTFWNPAESEETALTPCHWAFEVLTEPLSLQDRFGKSEFNTLLDEYSEEELDLLADEDDYPKYNISIKFHMGSVDTFLGLPFNIAFYGLLSQIIGKMVNMVPSEIIPDLSNVHIYEPHMDKVKEQLSRDTEEHGKCEVEFHPEFEIAVNAFNKGIISLDEFLKELRIDMFTLKGYTSFPRIPAEMLAYSN